ncbi:MAG: hypothetical protein M0Z64_07535 [Nitrospiraceae bacterium]|nr:hypothetical protein [Nitrospiraceae bacterium]
MKQVDIFIAENNLGFTDDAPRLKRGKSDYRPHGSEALTGFDVLIQQTEELSKEAQKLLERMEQGLPIHESAIAEFFGHVKSEADIIKNRLERLERDSKKDNPAFKCGWQQKMKCSMELFDVIFKKYGDSAAIAFIVRSLRKIKYNILENIIAFDSSYICRKSKEVERDMPKFFEAIEAYRKEQTTGQEIT